MDCGKGSTVVKVLGYVLERLVDMNRYVSCGTITKFQSLFVPEVTIEAYLERIEKYARCSESCYVIALIYIDRIVEMKNFVVSSLNVHRVVVTRYEFFKSLNIKIYFCFYLILYLLLFIM